MVAGNHVEFWTSDNLRQWTKASEWGATEAGCHGGNWETPDLFELPVDGNALNKKWVLSVGVMGGAPNGGLGAAYFIGSFDGKNFTNDNSPSSCLWQNFGKDYYAGVTWNNVPDFDGRRLMIAWADSWQYRFDLPTTPFNGQLSLIKELKLKTFPEGVRLVKTPIAEYEQLRGLGHEWKNQIITPNTNLLSGVSGDKLEIIAEFEADSATATEFGIKVRKGVSDETVVGYDKSAAELFVDRTNAGMTPNVTGTSPNPDWAGKHKAPVPQVNGKVKLRIFVDRSSVEVLGNDREWISDLILPDRNSLGLETYAIGGKVQLSSLKVYQMNRIWSEKSPFSSTNLSGWFSVKGEWADTINGKEGSADHEGFILSSQRASDFEYSANIRIKGVQAGNPRPIKQEAAGGIIFRANETVSKGYAANINANTDTLNLIKYDGNGIPTILHSYSTTIDTNTTYNIKAATSGSSIKIYLNNKLCIDINDPVYRSGFVGLTVHDALVNYNHVYLTKNNLLGSIIERWNSLSAMVKNTLENRKNTPRYAVSGTWTDITGGTKGMALGDGFNMSKRKADDFSYEADIKISGSDGMNSAAALVFRANSSATQGYAANLDVLNDCVTLFKWNGDGTSTTIKRYAYSLDADRNYHLKVEANHDHFQIYLDGKCVIDEFDSSFRSGLLGLNAWNSESSFTGITIN